MSNGSKVHDLLHIALTEHGKAGLAAGHDIRMIAEDAQRMACDGTGGDMEHGGKKLACHLVHVGYHKEQTLGSGVGGGKSACVEAAVDSACRTGLCLHLLHLNGAAEDVLLTLCRPLVNEICHGAGRGDGVNGSHFGERICYVRRSGIAIHRLFCSRHVSSSITIFTGPLRRGITPAANAISSTGRSMAFARSCLTLILSNVLNKVNRYRRFSE